MLDTDIVDFQQPLTLHDVSATRRNRTPMCVHSMDVVDVCGRTFENIEAAIYDRRHQAKLDEEKLDRQREAARRLCAHTDHPRLCAVCCSVRAEFGYGRGYGLCVHVGMHIV